jgi:hypothetical protein
MGLREYFSNNLKKRRSRRAAFSLVTVLLISVAGVSLLGAILYTFSTFAAASRVTVFKDIEYNSIQNEIEKAKALLTNKMKERTTPLTLDHHKLEKLKDAGGKITTVDDILVSDSSDSAFGKWDDIAWSHGDESGTLSVRIYDMLYDEYHNESMIPANAAEAGMSEEAFERLISDLPPALSLKRARREDEANPLHPDEFNEADPVSGVYLIRAALVLDSGEKKLIETDVIQSAGGNDDSADDGD